MNKFEFIALEKITLPPVCQKNHEDYVVAYVDPKYVKLSQEKDNEIIRHNNMVMAKDSITNFYLKLPLNLSNELKNIVQNNRLILFPWQEKLFWIITYNFNSEKNGIGKKFDFTGTNCFDQVWLQCREIDE